MTLRRVVFAFIALLFLAAAFASAVAWRARTRLAGGTEVVLASVSRSLGAPVAATGVTVAWWPPAIVAQGLSVPDESPFGPGSLARADEARIGLSVWALLHGEILVTRLELLRPVVRIVHGAEGGWNITSARRPARSAPSVSDEPDRTAPGARIALERIRVEEGQVRFRNRAVPGGPEIEVRDLRAAANLRGSEYQVDWTAAVLGGGENFRGRARMTIDRDRDVSVEVQGIDLPGEGLWRAAPLVLHREVPFAVGIDGPVQLRIDGRFAPDWPPTTWSADLAVDLTRADLVAAGGWVEKNVDVPARFRFSLRGEPDALEVAAFELDGGEARIEGKIDPLARAVGDGIDGEEEEPPTLRFSAGALPAGLVAQWVPALGAARPDGTLAFEGLVRGHSDALVSDVRIAAPALTLREFGGVQVADASLRLRAGEHGAEPLAIHLRVGGWEGATFSLADVDLFAEGPVDGPLGLVLRLGAAGPAAGRFERVYARGETAPGRLRVHRLVMDGLGGRVTAAGEVQSVSGRGLRVDVEPAWNGVDLEGALRFLGRSPGASGVTNGRASLRAEGGTSAALWASLSGPVQVLIDEAWLPGVDLPRATVEGLSRGGSLERRLGSAIEGVLAGRPGAGRPLERAYVAGHLSAGAFDVVASALWAADYDARAYGRLVGEGESDLRARIRFTPAASQEVLEATGARGLVRLRGDRLAIPLEVRGTPPELTVEPVTSELPALFSGPLGESSGGGAGRLLRRLLGDPSGGD